jgi:hypothetical protein
VCVCLIVISMMQINRYAAAGQWASLSKLANDKKSPVGYLPFAKACIQYNQPDFEIQKYVDKITSNSDKFELFVERKSWRLAADCARGLRDTGACRLMDRLLLSLPRTALTLN